MVTKTECLICSTATHSTIPSWLHKLLNAEVTFVMLITMVKNTVVSSPQKHTGLDALFLGGRDVRDG